MISSKSHSRAWIESQRELLGRIDPLILEKGIFALTLLDALGATDLDFVFKGGTALLLHLPNPNRLSIDIDIVCTEEQETLEARFNELLPGVPFTHWDESQRGERGLPGRRHYRFHYQSPLSNRESHILLDVVTEENVLTDLIELPVVTAFLEVESSVTVRTPSLDSLLADKLTAFAPQSVGVPLNERFSLQVIKQLFDIAELYDSAHSPAIIARENLNSFNAEARYCNFTGSHHDYLDDVIQSSFRICALDLRGAPQDQPDSDQLLRRGIAQLSNHLVARPFRLPQAKLAAAKAACLAHQLKTETQPSALPRFQKDAILGLKSQTLGSDFHCLNRLKSFAPEVFYFWTQVSQE